MDKKIDSINDLKSISLEDEEDEDDKKEFTKTLITPDNNHFFCIKKFLNCFCCFPKY